MSDKQPALDPQAAQAYAARWKLVNEAEILELRQTPLETKFRQLCSLMESVRQLGWDERLAAEDEEVRNRWIRLRQTYGH